MNARDAIKISLRSTQEMVQKYLADLSDDDLLVRPVPAANHIAWQIGHLIAAEAWMGGLIPGAKYPELPAAIQAQGDGKSANVTPPGGFPKKAEYLDWFNKVRKATIELVDRLSESDMDKASPPECAQWAPTVGHLLVLTSTHTMMHAGQFTVVRRALNKPVLF
jgi:hypothetical protein